MVTKRWGMLAAVAVGLWLVGPLSGQEPVATQQPFMRAKLVHAQKLLEGLALRDLNSVADHAQKLSLLSLESTWQVYHTGEYEQFSREFRRATQAMSDAAKANNLDQATLAYVDMTLKCVNCHQHVRDLQNKSSGDLRKLAE